MINYAPERSLGCKSSVCAINVIWSPALSRRKERTLGHMYTIHMFGYNDKKYEHFLNSHSLSFPKVDQKGHLV